jgi:hypothetical protein
MDYMRLLMETNTTVHIVSDTSPIPKKYNIFVLFQSAKPGVYKQEIYQSLSTQFKQEVSQTFRFKQEVPQTFSKYLPAHPRITAKTFIQNYPHEESFFTLYTTLNDVIQTQQTDIKNMIAQEEIKKSEAFEIQTAFNQACNKMIVSLINHFLDCIERHFSKNRHKEISTLDIPDHNKTFPEEEADPVELLLKLRLCLHYIAHILTTNTIKKLETAITNFQTIKDAHWKMNRFVKECYDTTVTPIHEDSQSCAKTWDEFMRRYPSTVEEKAAREKCAAIQKHLAALDTIVAEINPPERTNARVSFTFAQKSSTPSDNPCRPSLKKHHTN